jgi:hypothetical protein
LSFKAELGSVPHLNGASPLLGNMDDDNCHSRGGLLRGNGIACARGRAWMN